MASLLKKNLPLFLSLSKLSLTEQIAVRCMATHWDPKFKRLRKNKFTEPNLLDFDSKTQDKVKRGVEPPGSFMYKPINITCSKEIFDPYVPPEGDGKASLFSKEFAKGALEQITKATGKKFKHLKVIKKNDESFDEKLFGELAQQIYIDAHNALSKRDPDEMLKYVTENALMKMHHNMKFKTIEWKWIESLEEPIVRHFVTREMLTKNDLYAQVTVRIHSKQILAIYDRFGRLAFGSDALPKDVLEFVVFEKHLTNPYGAWRIHDKVVPSWSPAKSPVIRSYVLPDAFKVDEELEKRIESSFKKDDSHLEKVSA
ncbi:unnamed protein product [Brachionus calyciflorus]|uniref:Large ribosomal subunit protein mL45 n=1 Tax=Brachionus calyciflorus TaxID=104777 RepID=A0A813W838_9BILA|nr:unnamed protein product [Brachionus calyciflorus]